MPDFSRRSTGPEKMDDLQVEGSDLHQALGELDTINYLLGGNYVTLNALMALVTDSQVSRRLRVADVGCGSGDMLKRIRNLLDKRRIDASLTGFDANPHVVRFARDHTPPECRITYEALNVFSDEFQRLTFDIITGTLFFHHLTDTELVSFLSRMKTQARLGIVINDIHRHWLSYYSIKWLTRIFSKSYMVRHDAPVSVLRAFKRRELEQILHEAGIVYYRIKWRWAFRWQVIVPSNPSQRNVKER